MAKYQVRAIQDIVTGGGSKVPKGTIGTHLTTQLGAPWHILVKWPRIGTPCDTDPKQVERI